jgi:predicted acyl esterase
LTWDSRGFGESGGTVDVDSKDFEGRDVSALPDWLTTQPEQQLDGADDPRVGMTGASYAGGIELVAAAIDHRIDAIAPSIAWHSLLTALYRDDLVKGGWAAALAGLGIPTATLLGVISPAGVQTGTVDQRRPCSCRAPPTRSSRPAGRSATSPCSRRTGSPSTCCGSVAGTASASRRQTTRASRHASSAGYFAG